MSTLVPAVPTAPPPPRQPLGLPAGSVRALLAIGVLGICWLLAARGVYYNEPVPRTMVYLQYVLILILAHYFAAHGKSIGRAATGGSALGLPGGTMRLLLILGYGGLAVFMFVHQDSLHYQARRQVPAQGEQAPKEGGEKEAPKSEQPQAMEGPPILLLSLLIGGFILGLFLSTIMRTMGGGITPFWYQDVQAWFALLALGGLVILAMIHGFINPTLTSVGPIDTSTLEVVLAAVIGFYFGARS
jgi:hypothetical protein